MCQLFPKAIRAFPGTWAHTATCPVRDGCGQHLRGLRGSELCPWMGANFSPREGDTAEMRLD